LNTSEERRVAVLAPAKVNLFLEVLGRRPDGFHEIDTVFQAVSLYDRLTCSPAERLELEVRPESADVPRDERNLVLRAAHVLAAHTGTRQGARITLEKVIPAGAGLGGGSSDAAAALVAFDRLWRTDVGRDTLRSLAAQLGSDVPFFLLGGTARGRGRGERLEPIAACACFWYVLTWSGAPISTATAYARLDDEPAFEPRSPAALTAAIERGDATLAGAALFNRLEEVAKAIEPGVGGALDRLREAGAPAARVTGSGSAVFGLFRSLAEAQRAAAALKSGSDDSVWLVHTETSGVECQEMAQAPAPGSGEPAAFGRSTSA
jgi:4-diphosphocytidyl-2-C-methyl-D-erythritol kinase